MSSAMGRRGLVGLAATGIAGAVVGVPLSGCGASSLPSGRTRDNERPGEGTICRHNAFKGLPLRDGQLDECFHVEKL